MKTSFDFFSRLRRQVFGRKERASLKSSDFIELTDRPLFGPDRHRSFGNTLETCLNTWRNDPLGRRLVSLTTQFSVGRGFRIAADDPESEVFLHEFWKHPLNRMDARLMEWSDELCRTGNLFVMLSSDSGGMSYVRAIPTAMVEEIISEANDIEQPALFRLREASADEEIRFPELKSVEPASLLKPETHEAMLHFTVNRPVGAQWGESDLTPVLPWLERYREWLLDRCELNHYRSSFVYMVKTARETDFERHLRQEQLNLTRPNPGQVFVVDADEEWQVIKPNFESADANEDGLAIKKMIAAGMGIPVSFLAEPGSASKAESSGMEDSACRNFRQRQQTLLWIVETVLQHVLVRGAHVRRELDPDCEIHVYGDDISAPGMSEGGIF